MPPRPLLAIVVLALAGCISVPPVHPRALENAELCARELNSGNHNQAEVYCDLGLDFSPQYADLWVNKGLIALRRGNKDLAKQYFIKALRYNQEQAQAYSNLGYVYLQEGAYGKAHDNFQRALKVNPDYREARFNLALTLVRLEKYDRAKKEFRTLLALEPNLADPHRELGVVNALQGNFEEAVEHLKAAVERDPDFAAAWLDLGAAYSELAKYSEAADAFKECLRVNPEDAQCRSSLAIVARKAALLDPALKEVRDTRTAEQTPRAHHELGLEYRERGLRREEAQAFRRCVQLDGRYAPCHFALYEIFTDEGKDRDARIACKNFLKFAPTDQYPREVQICERHLASDTF